MQMLKITSTPMEYKIEIEKPKLELKQSNNPKQKMHRSSATLDLKTKDIQVRLDTTEMRSSIGLKSADRILAEGAERGINTAMQATAKYAQFGNQIAQINKGVTISDIISRQMLRQPTTQTVFLPSVGPEISWDPANINVDYKAGSLGFDWEVEKSIMEFIPGKFTMNIVQYPKVTIEYLGGPNYVPPSADPEYVEE